MVKEELIKRVAEDARLNGVQAEAAVNVMFSLIGVALEHEEKVTIKSFGTFELQKRNERIGRNPRTGEPVTIPARFKPVFKPSKTLMETLNS